MTSRIVKLCPDNPAPEKIQPAAAILREGGLVVFPTETVYGLGVNLLNKEAVERAYRVKRRDRSKPFTILIANKQDAADRATVVPLAAQKMIETFWPGPLTIILKTKEGGKVGLRMPDNRIALALIKACGVPVGAPSANISGQPPPLTAAAARETLGEDVDIVIDGGRAALGIASTVVDLTVCPFRVLREGAIKKEWLEGFRKFEEA